MPQLNKLIFALLLIGMTGCIHKTEPYPVTRTTIVQVPVPKVNGCPDPAQVYKQISPKLQEGCH